MKAEYICAVCGKVAEKIPYDKWGWVECDRCGGKETLFDYWRRVYNFNPLI